MSTKQDSAHNFLSSTLGSRFGSGSWPLSLVSDSEPIVGSGLKSNRDRLRDQTDSESKSNRSLRHKGMDNISNLKPIHVRMRNFVERGHEMILEGSIEGVSFEMYCVCVNVKCGTLFDMVVKQGHVVCCVWCHCGEGGGEEKRKTCVKRNLYPKGQRIRNNSQTNIGQTSRPLLRGIFNTFDVTSHNFDVLTNNFCRCFTQVFVLSTKQDSAHNFLSSTLGSRFGSGSWPLSLVSDSEPIVGSGLKSNRDRLRDQTDSESKSNRSLRHKGMDNISNLKPVVGPYPS